MKPEEIKVGMTVWTHVMDNDKPYDARVARVVVLWTDDTGWFQCVECEYDSTPIGVYSHNICHTRNEAELNLAYSIECRCADYVDACAKKVRELRGEQ